MIELIAVAITVLVLLLLVIFYKGDQKVKVKEQEKRQQFENFLSGKGFSSTADIEARLESIYPSIKLIRVTKGEGTVTIKDAFLNTKDNSTILCHMHEWGRYSDSTPLSMNWTLIWPAKDDKLDPELLERLSKLGRFQLEKGGPYYFLQDLSVLRFDSDEQEINRLLALGDQIKKGLEGK